MGNLRELWGSTVRTVRESWVLRRLSAFLHKKIRGLLGACSMLHEYGILHFGA